MFLRGVRALKQIQNWQTALLSYIVTAENRVANAKPKVEYARARGDARGRRQGPVRETPQEQRFASRNTHYLEAVGVHKLFNQYTLKKTTTATWPTTAPVGTQGRSNSNSKKRSVPTIRAKIDSPSPRPTERPSPLSKEGGDSPDCGS